ncbi:MAG TPA: UMP kinase [Patescibacteria group bacterium]|nr:UMP kinase [Patescibacteria group bacterium]
MRILLKVSGEFFGGGEGQAIDVAKTDELAHAILAMKNEGAEIGVVVGGGNIFRKRYVEHTDVDPIIADYMGITATIINGLLLWDRLRVAGGEAVLQSAWPIDRVVDGVDPSAAVQAVSSGKVVVFAAGTGVPYVTTDTGVVERAIDVRADVIVKATKVDGVYDKDPVVNGDAQKFETLTMAEAIARGLEIMDKEALEKSRSAGIAIRVVEFSQENLVKVARGENIGTLVTPE